MHDQHVYSGPAGWSLAVLYGLVTVSAIVGGVALSRANAGVSGRAGGAAGPGRSGCRRRDRRMGGRGRPALPRCELRDRLRGVRADLPLIALAAAAGGINAMRESWLQLGLCIAIIAVASVSTFFGPLGSGDSPAWAAACCCWFTPPPWWSSSVAREGSAMTTNTLEQLDPLDPLIHVPARLRILVTLAALNAGDTLSFTRLRTCST